MLPQRMRQTLADIYDLLFPRLEGEAPPTDNQLFGLVAGFGIFLLGMLMLIKK